MKQIWASLIAQSVKNPPAMQETRVRFLGQEDPLMKEMATHSITLAWRIPWTGEPVQFSPCTVQSMRSVTRVGHDWVTFTHSRQMQWAVTFEDPWSRSSYPTHEPSNLHKRQKLPASVFTICEVREVRTCSELAPRSIILWIHQLDMSGYCPRAGGPVL